jgi:membrane protein YqaA with SNARE-associated domain
MDKSPANLGKTRRVPKIGYFVNHSAVFFGIFILILCIPFWFYYSEIREVARHAVENYGYPALFILTWLTDAFIQPLPADVFVFASTFGGAPMLLTAFVAGLASSLGGFTGFYIGRMIGARRFARYFGRDTLRTGRRLFRQYGSLAIFISGVSPIPYSAVCYMGGIFNMSIWRLFLASIASRTARYIFMGWLGNMA